MLKTQRSEDPLSKSMFMVWPPMLMGARYSTSPCSGVAATRPLPAVAEIELFVDAGIELFVDPVPNVPVDFAPVAEVVFAAFAEAVGAAFAFAFPPAAPVKPLSAPSNAASPASNPPPPALFSTVETDPAVVPPALPAARMASRSA